MGAVPEGATTAQESEAHAKRIFWRERGIDVVCVLVWIFLSAVLVFYNKFLLSYFGFSFPITLTLWHMVVCTSLASACVLAGMVEPLDIPTDLYIKKIFPIAACYAGALWTSNEAYAISSVSFAQLVKAGMPVMVFLTGLAFGTERFTCALLVDIVLVTLGVSISAFGEAHLVVKGLLLLVLSMAFDAVRLTLTQQMIQSSGLRFNPITTLYYIAPVASFFLAIPFVLLEVKGAAHFVANASGLWHFLLNGLNAFGLNLAVYLLIGRTSALTMNVCGLIKDWFTISASVVVFGSVVTVTNLIGYGIAFVGVVWYNYLRLPRATSQEEVAALAKALEEGQQAPEAPGGQQQERWQQQQESEQHPLLAMTRISSQQEVDSKCVSCRAVAPGNG